MSTVYLNAGETACSCGDCGWTGPATDLDAISDIQERLDPGSEVPAGQCPECGALAYLDSKALELDAAAQLTTAARAMLAALKTVPLTEADTSYAARQYRNNIRAAIAAAGAAGIAPPVAAPPQGTTLRAFDQHGNQVSVFVPEREG